jgi:hypothetical protein
MNIVFRRFFIALGLLGLLGLLSACLPGMSPVGSPSNPAGVASPEKSDGSSEEAGPSADLPANPPSGPVGDSPAPIPVSKAEGPSGGGTAIDGNVYAIARGGTFNPKGDGESVGGDQQKEATDWRLRFGVNVWWELSRTTPDLYPVFKDTATDFKMKLEFQSRDSGQWVLAGPTPYGTPVVRMVYQPKGQAAQPAQAFVVGDAFPEGYNAAFLNLNLGEGTVTFSVEYLGVAHPLGSLTTYFSDAGAADSSAPALFR